MDCGNRASLPFPFHSIFPSFLSLGCLFSINRLMASLVVQMVESACNAEDLGLSHIDSHRLNKTK